MVRYYDEKIYLSENKDALDQIYNLRSRYISNRYNNLIYFKEEIIEYYNFIDKVKNFLLSFKVENQIQYALMISLLMRTGIFSITDEFNVSTNLKNELEGFLGLNILYGSGCCRNCTSFFNDVMKASNYYSESLYCKAHDNKFDFSRKKEANHVINLIDYLGKLYGFDSINVGLFTFCNKEELKLLSTFFKKYLRFKPYFGVITDKYNFEDIKDLYQRFEAESKTDSITISCYNELLFEILSRLKKEEDVLLDFKNDTMSLKESVYNEVDNKIRKMNNS